jgi:CelD/BcsL family acetyltransferase involved in cellulose biosynthesis
VALDKIDHVAMRPTDSRSPMTPGATILDDTRLVEPVLGAWDALAARCGKPFSAPQWLMAWWANARPPGAELRIVVVGNADQLIGVMPMFLDTSRAGLRALRPLGAGACQRVEPLALPGTERYVAARLARVLASATTPPDVIQFEGIDRTTRWPALLAQQWPGMRAIRLVRQDVPAPTVHLDGDSFDGWLAGKSRNFRHDLGKKRRRFERRGGRIRMVTGETLEADLRGFSRLHRARWDWRGGSAAMTSRMDAMLLAAGRALGPGERFRLLSLDLDGEVVSSHLSLSVGGEYGYWLAGFDDRYGELSTSLLGAVAVVQDAFECGAQRVDLGSGALPYKLRFATDHDVLTYEHVVPVAPRALLVAITLAPGQFRRFAKQHTPPQASERLKAIEANVLQRLSRR